MTRRTDTNIRSFESAPCEFDPADHVGRWRLVMIATTMINKIFRTRQGKTEQNARHSPMVYQSLFIQHRFPQYRHVFKRSQSNAEVGLASCNQRSTYLRHPLTPAFLQVLLQMLNLAQAMSPMVIIWFSLMLVTNTQSPIVVVLSYVDLWKNFS